MLYIAKPVVVTAFEIIQIGKLNEDGELPLVLDTYEHVLATREMLARMAPVVGDYWVIQNDDYVYLNPYLNPKNVFERKYTSMR